MRGDIHKEGENLYPYGPPKPTIVIPIGSKVIVRSGTVNEGIFVGFMIGYETFDKHHQRPFPLVADKFDKEYVCMGLVVEYTDELELRLSKLSTPEQWNMLSSNTQMLASGAICHLHYI